MLVCTFVCANRTRDRGCSKHPVFPAPSDKRAGSSPANLGRNAPRDREVVLCIATASTPSSLRTQDPYAAADVVLPRRSTAFVQQWATVAMGPYVRTDDALM